MTDVRERRAVFFALTAVGLWSTVAAAFKIALKDLKPFDFLTLATFFSWLSLAAVRLLRRFRAGQTGKAAPDQAAAASGEPVKISSRQFLAASGLGLINPLLYYLVLFAAYDRLPAQMAQPLNYTWPLFLALLAAPLAGKIPRKRDWQALILSFAGVICVSWTSPAGTSGGSDLPGAALALGSGLIWAVYWLLGGRLKMYGERRLFIGFSTALVPLLLIWLIRGAALPENPGAWTAVIWAGLFEMGITFLAWNAALEHTQHPARIGNLVYLGPFASLIWIQLILGEQIRFQTIVGLLIIILGILLGRSNGFSLRRRKKIG